MTINWVARCSANKLWNQSLHALLLLSLFFVATLASTSQEAHLDTSSTEHNIKTGNEQQNADLLDKRTPYVSMDDDPLDSYAYAYLPSSSIDAEIMDSLRPNKRGLDDAQMPGVLRFGKRAQSFIRFGRSAGDGMPMFSKKEMPGVLRFGKRRVDGQQEKKAVPGVLRFGKRDSDIPGVLRFGKRDSDIPGVLRFGKRYDDLPAGVLRFGKRGDMPGVLRFGKKSDMPGVLRFGKRGDMPGVLRFGKRSTDMPGVLRFG